MAITTRRHYSDGEVRFLQQVLLVIDVGRYELRHTRWSLDAKCRLEGIPTTHFFPAFGDRARREWIADYCKDCPVRIDCLNFGLNWPDETFGYFGGVLVRTREQRRKGEALLRRLEDQRMAAEREASMER